MDKPKLILITKESILKSNKSYNLKPKIMIPESIIVSKSVNFNELYYNKSLLPYTIIIQVNTTYIIMDIDTQIDNTSSKSKINLIFLTNSGLIWFL